MRIEGGTLAIDVSAEGGDALVLTSPNKGTQVIGGTVRVNRFGGFAPKVGTSWDIITGTAPASGRGFASVVDASGKGYAIRSNRWRTAGC